MTKKDYRFLFLLFSVFCSLFSVGYAKEITILYTGDTQAMLYPCNCPTELEGGVARRAALIKQLKRSNPDTLVLDAGNFFAGGLMDEYKQNTELDKERSRVNLKAMELIQYDAVVIGDDEFNFGPQFLEENIKKTRIPFLSCNLESDIVLPYLIKEIAGIKVGIIGLTSLYAAAKAGGLEFIEPVAAVKQAREELKKKGADIIVLLSQLAEGEDLKLIEEVKGIDILITGHRGNRNKDKSSSRIDSTLVLWPSWQGRELSKLSLAIKDKQISNYKAEQLRLSDKIGDDPGVLAILPRCFSDSNCKKEGFVGTCQDPGTINSRCLFSESAKINLSVIMPEVCRACNAQIIVSYLNQQFPGLVVSYLYYPGGKAYKLVRDFGIKTLPAYFLGREIEKETGFKKLKENLERKGDFYLLKPQFAGISYFLERKGIKGKLDLFISLYDKNAAQILEIIKEFNPTIHFLALWREDKFDALKGDLEVEEYLRSVCVEKYYPQKFWDYISCRAKSINSSWWEDCLGKGDAAKIITCARSDEGRALLKENISLNKELQVMFGPAYLLNNREIFGSKGVPAKEELKKLIKR